VKRQGQLFLNSSAEKKKNLRHFSFPSIFETRKMSGLISLMDNHLKVKMRKERKGKRREE